MSKVLRYILNTLFTAELLLFLLFAVCFAAVRSNACVSDCIFRSALCGILRGGGIILSVYGGVFKNGTVVFPVASAVLGCKRMHFHF